MTNVQVFNKKVVLQFTAYPYSIAGGGATRPLPRNGGVEGLHRDPTIGPHPKVWTRGQKWKK